MVALQTKIKGKHEHFTTKTVNGKSLEKMQERVT